MTRKLGHELEIPGSAKWRLYTDNTAQCYVCDHKVFALFFWAPEIGMLQGDETGLTELEKEKISNIIFQERVNQPVPQVDPQLLEYPPKIKYNTKNRCFEEDPSASESSIESDNEKKVYLAPLPEKYQTPHILGEWNNWRP